MPTWGELNFQIQRVLDVGTASGYLTFQMEKRGADVVSFDMPSAGSGICSAFLAAGRLGQDRRASLAGPSEHAARLLFAHRCFGTRARVPYGDVHNLPWELGNFDVVFPGMILPHLRDPFQVLDSASRLASHQIVFTHPGSLQNWVDPCYGGTVLRPSFCHRGPTIGPMSGGPFPIPVWSGCWIRWDLK
jgi:SAM-dependent methyltransferase